MQVLARPVPPDPNLHIQHRRLASIITVASLSHPLTMLPQKNAALSQRTADSDVVAVSAPRPRGRPRKIMEDAPANMPSADRAKRRGRPPRVRPAETSPTAVSAIPKKRARPDETVQDDTAIVILGYSRPPRPRMQPADIASEQQYGLLPAVPAPVFSKKRAPPPNVAPESRASPANPSPLTLPKRGRPRKVVPDAKVTSSVTTVPTIPRKRGRPPKVAEVEERTRFPAARVSAGAKKKGRPRKSAPAGGQPAPGAPATEHGPPAKILMQSERFVDSNQEPDLVTRQPAENGAVLPTIIVDTSSHGEDGQRAKRARVRRGKRSRVEESGLGEERPSWAVRFVAELGEHAELSGRSGVPPQKDSEVGDRNAEENEGMKDDTATGEDEFVGVPGGASVDFEDSEDDTFQTPMSGGWKPRLFHKDSVVSFFDPDAVEDGSPQAVVPGDVDMIAVEDPEHDVDGVELLEEEGDSSQEEVVDYRSARRNLWPKTTDCDIRSVRTSQGSRGIPETQEAGDVSPRTIPQAPCVTRTIPNTARTAQPATPIKEARKTPVHTSSEEDCLLSAMNSVATPPLSLVGSRSPLYVQIALPDIQSSAHWGTPIGPLVLQVDGSRYRITVQIEREKRPDIARLWHDESYVCGPEERDDRAYGRDALIGEPAWSVWGRGGGVDL